MTDQNLSPEAQLIEAIQTQDIGWIISALDADPTVIDRPDPAQNYDLDKGLRTPFSYACSVGNLEIVNLLLDRGTKAIFTPNRYGSLPIHWACHSGHGNIIHRLIEVAPEITPGTSHLLAQTSTGRTPLWYLANQGEVSLIPLIFNLAPEAFFVESLDSPGIILTSTFIDNPCKRAGEIGAVLLQLAIATFGLDRIRAWIQTYPEVVSNALKFQDLEYFRVVKPFFPGKFGSSDRESMFQDWFGESVRGVDSTEASLLFELVEEGEFKILDLKFMLFRAIYYHRTDLVTRILRQSQRQDGPDWIQKILLQSMFWSYSMEKEIALSVALREPRYEILAPLLDQYLSLISDPFIRGQLHGIVVLKSSFLCRLAKSFDPRIIALGMHFLNRLAGPEILWSMFGELDSNGWSLAQIAASNKAYSSLEFLLGYAAFLPLNSIATSDPSCQRILQAVNMIHGIETIPEDTVLSIRNRVYFSESLTDRLLYFI